MYKAQCARLMPGWVALLTLAGALALRAQSSVSERDIRSVLEAQQAAWNRGDVEGFMAGYAASDATTFVGATITHGYQQVLENYRRRYPTREKMGQLAFSDLEVKLLGADYASVIGKWHLARPADAGGDVGGVFTLLFHKAASGWKIILDHTS
ncbi:MAG TPA: nuclear transport factor 2 family protein [Bryobacteraceae bacterium]|nr:nuclear transport factor 2 family protein [Bryobacteraceae bacterium]